MKKKRATLLFLKPDIYTYFIFFFFTAAYSASYLLDRIIHLCNYENTTIIILNWSADCSYPVQISVSPCVHWHTTDY